MTGLDTFDGPREGSMFTMATPEDQQGVINAVDALVNVLVSVARRGGEAARAVFSARMYLAFALWKLGRYDAVTNELLRQADTFGIARETLTHAA